MEREIKFRAWDSEEEKLMPVEYIDWTDEYVRVNEGDNSITDTMDMFELDQFLNIYDVKRTELYERDIVKFNDGTESIVSDISWFIINYHLNPSLWDRFEIIGNSHIK